MILFIFILVYLISVAIFLITCYYDNKNYIHDIGDLLDTTESFMWCPVLGGTNICIKRTELTFTDISYLSDLGYKFIPDDEEGVYCYISWE